MQIGQLDKNRSSDTTITTHNFQEKHKKVTSDTP